MRDFEALTILACAVQGGCCGMKNEVTKSVGFGFHYSWRKHIESQNNSIYSEFLQVEEELFGGDKSRA